ncbi:hypothetical protein EYF80_028690 [Liparis tanakae]|uniref:Uncharacterized protein n=1 Tax=Liparis tanakae TaxID=230148 RepID=A0A4Z2H5A0_9TELE|nr:hypothetical protein EYF80_028690 [Liparis tanakae]
MNWPRRSPRGENKRFLEFCCETATFDLKLHLLGNTHMVEEEEEEVGREEEEEVGRSRRRRLISLIPLSCAAASPACTAEWELSSDLLLLLFAELLFNSALDSEFRHRNEGQEEESGEEESGEEESLRLLILNRGVY